MHTRATNVYARLSMPFRSQEDEGSLATGCIHRWGSHFAWLKTGDEFGVASPSAFTPKIKADFFRPSFCSTLFWGGERESSCAVLKPCSEAFDSEQQGLKLAFRPSFLKIPLNGGMYGDHHPKKGIFILGLFAFSLPRFVQLNFQLRAEFTCHKKVSIDPPNRGTYENKKGFFPKPENE